MVTRLVAALVCVCVSHANTWNRRWLRHVSSLFISFIMEFWGPLIKFIMHTSFVCLFFFFVFRDHWTIFCTIYMGNLIGCFRNYY